MPPAFLFRPLATALDDKVALQDCLELGRKATVGALCLVVVKAAKKRGILRS